MKGDFSDLRPDAARTFSRVLQQQGRPVVDSDLNERDDLVLHTLRALAADLLGPGAGARDGAGFAVEVQDAARTLRIAPGRYWVGGIPCELHEATTVALDAAVRPPYLVLLDVWERYVSADEDPSLLDPALGGADTSGRARVVADVRAVPLRSATAGGEHDPPWPEVVAALQPAERGRLAVRTRPGEGYTGLENALYRVEVHAAGDEPVLKWSRENGSVTLPIVRAEDREVVVAHLADELHEGVLVEVEDSGALLRVEEVDPGARRVELSGAVDGAGARLLRRWDGTIPAADAASWTELEAAIEVRLAAPAGALRRGDYWTVPARPAITDVRWPRGADGEPAAVTPHGVEHRYAPLAVVLDPVDDGAGTCTVVDRRRLFDPVS